MKKVFMIIAVAAILVGCKGRSMFECKGKRYPLLFMLITVLLLPFIWIFIVLFWSQDDSLTPKFINYIRWQTTGVDHHKK